jgi:VanZ family protein
VFVIAFLKNTEDRKTLVTGVLFVIMYGISDEIHQSFVPTRNPKFTDVLFDTIGGIIGFLLTSSYLKLSRSKS